MKHFISYLFALAFIFPVFAAPIDFSDKEKTVIYTHSMNALKDYQRFINEMGEFAVNNMEAAQSSSESFLELFVNRQVLIFNDLDPAHSLSPFYEAETYITNLFLWYPDGMRIDMDFENAKVGNIMQHEDEIYSLDILMPKNIDGNYLNRTLNKNTEDLLFRIAFNRKGGGFGNYKIVGIRNTDTAVIPDFNKNLEEVNSEQMDENDLIKVSDGMRAVMYDYSNFLALLGDPEEFEEDKVYYRESFKALFENVEVKIYNDITPNPENSLLSVEDYLLKFSTDYPKGISNISLPVDSAIIGKAIKTEEGYYYAYLNIDKFFSGNYQEKEVLREMFPLTVKIRFDKSGNAFTDFKIQSIDIEVEDYYQASENAEEFSLPEMSITTISRKGWSMGIEGSYGLSPVENAMLNSVSMDYDAHTWESTPGYGIKAGLNAYYFINDNIGFKTGVSFNTYESSFKLSGTFTDTELSTDLNDDSYHKIIAAEYDSAVSLSYVGIPFVFNYTSGVPGKIGFFAEVGAVVGIKATAQYESTGDYQFYGYYPSHPAVTQYLYIEELGFYDEKNINRQGDVEIASLNISAYASFGLNVSIGYFSSLKIAPELYFGISDIDAGYDYSDIFGKVKPHEATVLKKYGIKMSYILKL